MYAPTLSPATARHSVQALFTPVLFNPLDDRVAFLNSGGVLSLRRQTVVREQHCGLRTNSKFPDESVMRVRIAEHTAPCKYTMTGRSAGAFCGRKILTETEPYRPPRIVRSSISTGSILTGPH